jgi:hypothetical protein
VDASYAVQFYETEDGSSPGEEFLMTIDKKLAAKAYRILSMIERNGPNIREPYS